MKRQVFNIIDVLGRPVPYASVTINDYVPGGGGPLTTLYADDAGSIVVPNPIYMDAYGRGGCYMHSGKKVFTIAGSSIATYVLDNQPVFECSNVTMTAGAVTTPYQVTDGMLLSGYNNIPALNDQGIIFNRHNCYVNFSGSVQTPASSYAVIFTLPPYLWPHPSTQNIWLAGYNLTTGGAIIIRITNYGAVILFGSFPASRILFSGGYMTADNT